MIDSQNVLDIARDRDDSFVVTVQGPDEDGVIGAVAFDDADAIDASVWIGGDEAELFSPDAQWLNAALGQITLTFAASATEDLAPGTYPLEVFVTPNGTTDKIRAAACWARISDSPGASATTLPTYGTYSDLKTYGGGVWLDMLRNDGLANFLRERARAREWLDAVIVSALRPLDPRAVYGALVDGGSATHPDEPEPTLSALLAADGLVVTNRVRELVAVKALEFVCRARLTFESGDVWSSRARVFAMEANRLALGLRVVVTDPDADDPTATRYALHLGVCSLR